MIRAQRFEFQLTMGSTLKGPTPLLHYQPYLRTSMKPMIDSRLVRLLSAALGAFILITGVAIADTPVETAAAPSDGQEIHNDSLTTHPTPWTDHGWGEMTPERRAQAIAYSEIKNVLYFVTTFYSFLILILFLVTGSSAKIRAWATRLGNRRFFVLALYLLALNLIVLAVDFPFTYYSGYALEHQYEHSNQSFGQWFGEFMKGEAIGFVVGLLLLWLLYLAIRRSPRRWWLWTGAFTAPIAAFLIVIAPIVIAPMFNKFSPLSDEALKTKILALANRAGIPDSDIFEVDASKQSKKYNAYVTGLFGTKRIVLYDTILKDMEHEEILFVMSHEIGHYVMHHVWIGVGLVTAFVFLAAYLVHRITGVLLARNKDRWGFDNLADFASLPLILFLFSVFGFLFQPAFAGMGRYFEHKADEYGLAMTEDRVAAAKAFEKLAAKNLSNPDPSPFIEFWLYDHPTIKDRVTYVLSEKE